MLGAGCPDFQPSQCRTFSARLTRAVPGKGKVKLLSRLSSHRKTIHRDPGSASDKLQQPRTHLVLKGENESPEPLDHHILGRVLLVLRVVPPVLHIDLPLLARDIGVVESWVLPGGPLVVVVDEEELTVAQLFLLPKIQQGSKFVTDLRRLVSVAKKGIMV